MYEDFYTDALFIENDLIKSQTGAKLTSLVNPVLALYLSNILLHTWYYLVSIIFSNFSQTFPIIDLLGGSVNFNFLLCNF